MEPNKTTSPAETWLDTAVKKIRFKPDRKQVRKELEEHIEDKALDLQRIFPDMTREEAQERAVSDMGDPAEVGKELAKVHKPWLGYAWLASKVLLVFVLTVIFLFFVNGAYLGRVQDVVAGPGYSQEQAPVEAVYGQADDLSYQGSLSDSGPIQAGEYTFFTKAGELWTATLEGQPVQIVYLQLEVDHRRPIRPLNDQVARELWAQDDRGGVIPSRDGWDRQDGEREDRTEYVSCTAMEHSFFNERYEILLSVRSPAAEQVVLRYTTMGADLTIPLSLEVTQP